MEDIWKAVEAPRATFKTDHSTFYLPEGPLAEDRFYVILPRATRVTVDRDGPSAAGGKVKIKTARRGTFTRRRLVVDLNPCREFHRPNIVREENMTKKLAADAKWAGEKLAKAMAGLLWHRIFITGGVPYISCEEVADRLEAAAKAMFEFTELAGRHVEMLRLKHEGRGGPAMSLASRRMLELLGLVEWYRIHRAVNAVQALEKAFRRWADKHTISNNFVGLYMLGMLGWRFGPQVIGEQQGALSRALHSLMILGSVDWEGFNAGEVTERMERMGTPIEVVKDGLFSCWAYSKVRRFLSHGCLECDGDEVQGRVPSRWKGHILWAHLEMMRALPWVEVSEQDGHTSMRLYPVPEVKANEEATESS
ncbi:hypothetical protein CTRI78_v001242 [Colletotrichum trifolii]|uniref:Uncharacterized protein n=1 Tax=Colletotrichum trifolii TaxID=5466 RepID=A0A4R8RQN8_COLTR|nr:hypothetical protein CTRI78_v001242 [Colletotrichum trifolii]